MIYSSGRNHYRFIDGKGQDVTEERVRLGHALQAALDGVGKHGPTPEYRAADEACHAFYRSLKADGGKVIRQDGMTSDAMGSRMVKANAFKVPAVG